MPTLRVPRKFFAVFTSIAQPHDVERFPRRQNRAMAGAMVGRPCVITAAHRAHRDRCEKNHPAAGTVRRGPVIRIVLRSPVSYRFGRLSFEQFRSQHAHPSACLTGDLLPTRQFGCARRQIEGRSGRRRPIAACRPRSSSRNFASAWFTLGEISLENSANRKRRLRVSHSRRKRSRRPAMARALRMDAGSARRELRRSGRCGYVQDACRSI